MRPIEQQSILVTGATAGLGKELASELARRGATVLVHGRNHQRVEAAVEDIAESSGSDRLVPHIADLSSLTAVRRLAAEVSASDSDLNALVNNAGLVVAERTESEDGYELTFAVNYLAPYLLTRLLLPHLRQSGSARIVNVASIGQAPIKFDDVMLEHPYDMAYAYNQSKLALISFTFELAERLNAEGRDRVTATALHPATLMPTRLVLESVGRTIDTLEEGVEATLRLVIDPEFEGVSGVYFDHTDEAAADPQAYDPQVRRRLWELSEELCGLR
jgi:NAD(P)-dependent dehydrogenase (short-subunit alcohol dehydrogenase family)